MPTEDGAKMKLQTLWVAAAALGAAGTVVQLDIMSPDEDCSERDPLQRSFIATELDTCRAVMLNGTTLAGVSLTMGHERLVVSHYEHSNCTGHNTTQAVALDYSCAEYAVPSGDFLTATAVSNVKATVNDYTMDENPADTTEHHLKVTITPHANCSATSGGTVSFPLTFHDGRCITWANAIGPAAYNNLPKDVLNDVLRKANAGKLRTEGAALVVSIFHDPKCTIHTETSMAHSLPIGLCVGPVTTAVDATPFFMQITCDGVGDCVGYDSDVEDDVWPYAPMAKADGANSAAGRRRDCSDFVAVVALLIVAAVFV